MTLISGCSSKEDEACCLPLSFGDDVLGRSYDAGMMDQNQLCIDGVGDSIGQV